MRRLMAVVARLPRLACSERLSSDALAAGGHLPHPDTSDLDFFYADHHVEEACDASTKGLALAEQLDDTSVAGDTMAHSNHLSFAGTTPPLPVDGVQPRRLMSRNDMALYVLHHIPRDPQRIQVTAVERACNWRGRFARIYGPLLPQLLCRPDAVGVSDDGNRVFWCTALSASPPTSSTAGRDDSKKPAAFSSAAASELLLHVPECRPCALFELPPVANGSFALHEAAALLRMIPTDVSFEWTSGGEALVRRRRGATQNTPSPYVKPPTAMLLTLVGYHLRRYGTLLTRFDRDTNWSLHFGPVYGPLVDALSTLESIVELHTAPHGATILRWGCGVLPASDDGTSPATRSAAVRDSLRFTWLRGRVVEASARDQKKATAMGDERADAALIEQARFFGDVLPVALAQETIGTQRLSKLMSPTADPTARCGRLETLRRLEPEKGDADAVGVVSVRSTGKAATKRLLSASVVLCETAGGWVFIPQLKLAVHIPPGRVPSSPPENMRQSWQTASIGPLHELCADYSSGGATQRLAYSAPQASTAVSDVVQPHPDATVSSPPPEKVTDTGEAYADSEAQYRVSHLRDALLAAEEERRRSEEALESFVRAWVIKKSAE